ncbi:MAG TPA: DUF1614 domain-containing protein [Dehalococcoidia bacterium]
MDRIVYNPYGSAFGEVFLVLVVAGVAMLILMAVSSGFSSLGVSSALVGLVVIGSVVGSAINLPVGHVHSNLPLSAARLIRVNGILYRVPVRRAAQDTTIALNVGGALIPLVVCGYLALRFPSSIGAALLATVPVALGVHATAQLIPGLGVALPPYLPPLFAAGAAFVATIVLGGTRQDLFSAAYISGTLGTLIGADLLNLPRINTLGAPVASIGGAGTFDGIFLSGILAMLMVSLVGPFFPNAGQPEAEPEPAPPPPPARLDPPAAYPDAVWRRRGPY